jgi:hypothetical protein
MAFYRLSRPVYVVHIALPLFVLLSYCRYILRGFALSKLVFLILVAITLLPLTFHLVACDTSRIWTYPLFAAILAVFGLCEIFPNAGAKKPISFLLCLNAIAVIVFHVFILTPLLDGDCERFSNVFRVLFYAPPILLVTTLLGPKYVLSQRSNI